MSYINIKLLLFWSMWEGFVLIKKKERARFLDLFFPARELGFLNFIKKFLFTNMIQPPRF